MKLPDIKKLVTVKGIKYDQLQVIDKIWKQLLLGYSEDLEDDLFESCGSKIQVVLKDGKEIISISKVNGIHFGCEQESYNC